MNKKKLLWAVIIIAAIVVAVLMFKTCDKESEQISQLVLTENVLLPDTVETVKQDTCKIVAPIGEGETAKEVEPAEETPVVKEEVKEAEPVKEEVKEEKK